MWYQRQTSAVQASVKKLVAAGQLEFINGGQPYSLLRSNAGSAWLYVICPSCSTHSCISPLSYVGWCMHDEAAAHWIDMVDQTTLGHQFIYQEFGVTPTIGWQIDPFGHSATQAALLSAGVGFEGLFFGRIVSITLHAGGLAGSHDALRCASLTACVMLVSCFNYRTMPTMISV